MNNFQRLNTYGLALDCTKRNRPTQTRIRIRIPKNYHHEPIISHLISQHQLEVNILAALLGVNARDDGWFDLQLQGKSEQIDSALIYLSELNVEVWRESELERDGW
ncbi:ABC transporter [Hydrococcus rivularis NIES-593]|uniref:ABC transporter n=1 Tax=Hydrococcus rivularis NIES-593 TaxID=1921803 RepID=A0A1U7HNI6_9CYAN|nr:NIL domain-containing protein [Hydrococcus rivularis]OKH25137.1 ABC transporter [Hydrococcus rivularis NIES-593]